MTPRFSANLGFLWTDRPLLNAIVAAKTAGFDAVECHWPYAISADDMRAALAQTGLRMLGLNTTRGDVSKGEFGLCACPGREADARVCIDAALSYANAIDAGMVHVMAGNAEGAAAHAAFVDNLRYAAQEAAKSNITILIEPLNRFDAPHYFLRDTDQAVAILQEIAAPNLKLMFDCYHVQRTEGDVIPRLTRLFPWIGHIQMAAAPDRGAPDHGELNYVHVLAHLADLGWVKPIGAEYKPNGDTDSDLGWMAVLKDM